MGARLDARASPTAALAKPQRRVRALPRHRTQECWRPAFHRRRFTGVRQLQAEADACLVRYNRPRRNHSDFMRGRTPPRSSTCKEGIEQHDHRPKGPSVTSNPGQEELGTRPKSPVLMLAAIEWR